MKKLLVITLVLMCLVASVGCSEQNGPTIDFFEPEPTVEELCDEGNYINAYNIATFNEKKLILAENIAAVQSAVVVDALKDPTSFQLRDAYYETSSNNLVLYVLGANSYGAKVSSYWLFTREDDATEWSYYCSVSSLQDEEYKSYDDSEDRLEKLFNNLGRIRIRSAINNGLKLDKAAIKRINKHFEEDRLDEITLIDENTATTTY